MKAIPIELIRTDGGTQIRECKTTRTKIAEYATAMSEGSEFPPLVVFWDGEHYWLADGFHRLGAYNIVMQGLELPGLDIDCEVIDGTQRDAILYACGTNAEHGLRRTNIDKQNAVKTVLTNPLVALDDKGNPWTDRAISRICKVHWNTVAKWRAEYLENSPDRAVSRGRSRYTMKTGGINQDRQKTGVVVEFSSKWDYVYDRVKEIDCAIAELPEPHEAASNFPPSLAHGLTVKRCLEIQRWWQEFTRLWEARSPELRRRNKNQTDIEENLNAASC